GRFDQPAQPGGAGRPARAGRRPQPGCVPRAAAAGRGPRRQHRRHHPRRHGRPGPEPEDRGGGPERRAVRPRPAARPRRVGALRQRRAGGPAGLRPLGRAVRQGLRRAHGRARRATGRGLPRLRAAAAVTPLPDPDVQSLRNAPATLGSRLVDLESHANVALARTGVLTGTSAAAWTEADTGLSHAWETYRVL